MEKSEHEVTVRLLAYRRPRPPGALKRALDELAEKAALRQVLGDFEAEAKKSPSLTTSAFVLMAVKQVDDESFRARIEVFSTHLGQLLDSMILMDRVDWRVEGTFGPDVDLKITGITAVMRPASEPILPGVLEAVVNRLSSSAIKMNTYLLIFDQTAIRKSDGNMACKWWCVDAMSEDAAMIEIQKECKDSVSPVKVIVNITNPINPFEVAVGPKDVRVLGNLWLGGPTVAVPD
jgi:hypothetical protein